MANITGKGMSQKDLVTLLEEMLTLITELRTDIGTISTFQTEAKADIGTIATFQAALTAKLDADAGITDTDYASSLTEVVAMSATPVAAPSAAAPTITVDEDG